MSQAGILSTSSGPSPPNVPTNFELDQNDPFAPPAPPGGGNTVPQANNLRVSGDHGITTVQNSQPGDLIIRFIDGLDDTTNVQTVTILEQPTNSDSTTVLQVLIAGYGINTNTLLAYSIGSYGTAVVKNIAGVATIVSNDDFILNGDPELGGCVLNITTSGSDFVVEVTGVQDYFIEWHCIAPGIVTVP